MHNTGVKPELNFSIANILKFEQPVKGGSTSKTIAGKDTNVFNERTSQPKSPVTSNLPWLAYTRYCPPKIPSKYSFRAALNLSQKFMGPCNCTRQRIRNQFQKGELATVDLIMG